MKPLIVQSDNTLLLDVHSPDFEKARAEIALFSDLIKSPEHIHTYRISPLSLWNAASAGLDAARIQGILESHSRYAVPENILFSIRETIARFGKIRLLSSPQRGKLLLVVEDPEIRQEIQATRKVMEYLAEGEDGFSLDLVNRGTLKQALIKIGYPVKDEAPLVQGRHLPLSLRSRSRGGGDFRPRDYQVEAVKAWGSWEALDRLDFADTSAGAPASAAGTQTKAVMDRGVPGSGFGTVVLPCGSGKTIIGILALAHLQTHCLILTPNVAAVHQWIDELLDKTTLEGQVIGEYTGDRKEIRPITIATYQILVWRSRKDEEFPHFNLFREGNWGLIIYDEVHLLPAPVFRVTAEIQAVRRMGLTATLVREDGREEEVFTLVGPKRYDVPWKELEAKGWIATAHCREIRVELPKELKIPYAVADRRAKFRMASENPLKIPITKQLLDNHAGESILVIGQYLSQVEEIAAFLDAPIITGKTPNKERERLYRAFRKGEIEVLVVSKVANFAIDLPDASVAIQVSGTFGSRQEEAQRLGRILRPKERNSTFYSLVSRLTSEELFAANRQKFLTEQGYRYTIELWEEGELN